jgi:uncharacterized membrane protein YhaH (DUF805 family)
MYDRFRSYWWLWLLLTVVVMILNELFDRKVAGDKGGHQGGDALVAIVIVLLAALVWEALTNRGRSA